MNMELASISSALSHAAPNSRSPNERAWARFKRNRLGWLALWLLGFLIIVGTLAELVSNDKPLIAQYHGQYYFPIIKNYPETTFGGDFATPTDWLDPYIVDQFKKDGNWVLFTFNRYGADTVNYFAANPSPAAPSAENYLGSDAQGRDVIARLLYGFRVSIFFGAVLTLLSGVLGVIAGAVQGYFGGRVDLFGQRFIEIWGSMPVLYMLIIFASIFVPSLSLLIVLFALFDWISLADYVRAEFLRNRSLEFVKAARAMGLSNWQIIRRHILPNSMTPIITFLPFRMSASITALTALDFLGLGVPSSTPSLGELLHQGKAHLDAWWISVPTFLALVLTLTLLQLVGDALRDAFDTRKN
ncbi:MAG: ABC transporter permease [Burkholderiales bacterium]|nr:ABC transporter permease [Burkholderiales bacterium]